MDNKIKEALWPKNLKTPEGKNPEKKIQCWCGKWFKTELSRHQHEFMAHDD
jgi:hypothetical protein